MLKKLLPLTFIFSLLCSAALFAQETPVDVDAIKAEIAAKEG